MNPLAFSTLACPSWSIDTVIEKAAEFGYDAIEWRGGAQGHIPPTISARELSSLRKVSTDAGIAALSITTYTSFVSLLAEERQSHVDELWRYADLAAAIGAPYVRAFLGELPAHQQPDERLYETIADCLNLACAYAASLGVRIAVEPHDDFVRSAVVSSILDRSDSRLRVIWDLGNTFSIGEQPEEGFNRFKDRLAYVQVKDGRITESGWRLCPVGHGDVPLARAFELLLANRYQGAFSVEWEYVWHPELDPPEVALPAARRTIQKLLSGVRSETA